MKSNNIEILLATHEINYDKTFLKNNPHIKLFYTFESNLDQQYYADITAYDFLLYNSTSPIKGVFQHRRFLIEEDNEKILKYDLILKPELIINTLKEYDLITTKKSSIGINPRNHYYENHIREDLELLDKIIIKDLPDYLSTYKRFINSDNVELHFDNLIIAKSKIFNDYSIWLLKILKKLEKQINFEDGRIQYQKRALGFIAERLLNVYIIHNNLKVKEFQKRQLSNNLEYVEF